MTSAINLSRPHASKMYHFKTYFGKLQGTGERSHHKSEVMKWSTWHKMMFM